MRLVSVTPSAAVRCMGAAAAALTLLSGCATMRQTCRYDAGALVEQVTRSTVVGTGETELVSRSCADLAYGTRDTGLSDNASAVLPKVAELAVRAMMQESGLAAGGAAAKAAAAGIEKSREAAPALEASP